MKVSPRRAAQSISLKHFRRWLRSLRYRQTIINSKRGASPPKKEKKLQLFFEKNKIKMKKAPAGCGGNLEGWKRNDVLCAAMNLRLLCTYRRASEAKRFQRSKGGTAPQRRKPLPARGGQSSYYLSVTASGRVERISPAPAPRSNH